MIVIENKRCKPETLYRKYGADAIIADVTSKAQDGLAKPPYLLNWKDEPLAEGFSSGEFDVSEPSYVFACSDALSHYIIMMYALANGDDIPNAGDRNSNFVSMAKTMRFDFESCVLKPLFRALTCNALASHCVSKYKKGLLALDDYSLARLM